jgi:hypothetical protein
MAILEARLGRARERHRARAAAFVGAVCVGALAVPLSGVADASIVVTSTADSGAGTLREALATASPGETISIPTPGDYLATSAELAVTKDVTIQGAGPAVRIVGDGNNRVFNVTAANVTLSGLTVTGGGLIGASVTGGGIANATGTLVLSGVTVKGNSVSNPAGGIPQGGGVSNATGTLQIVDSTISGNSASIGAGGGGLPDGGGVANAGGSLSIIRSTVSDNTASIAGPGGAPEGGGIQSSGGQLTILDSTVRGNTGSGGAVALGGGIAAFFTTTTLTRTTVSGNAASEAAGVVSQGGGILQINGSLSLVNSTISGNTSAGSLTGEGGGLDAAETTVVTTNSTIAGNVASGPTALGGNVFSPREATVKLQNTIVAGGTALTGANCGAGPKSVIQSLGHNLDSLNECGFTAAGDVVNANPLLGPLSGNGGLTQTMALAPGSPAIDAAASATCPPTDPRGVLRPAGAGCDIGAFELATPSATSGQASAIGLTSATLNGLGSNPDLAGATAVFQYGTTAAYGLVLPTQAIGPTTAQATITAPVGNLTPATAYHFRLVVQNGVSTSFGADRTFMTAAPFVPPPLALVLSGLAVKPSNVLPELGKGASTARTRGARISYSDNAKATTTLTVSRISTGFRVGKRCQAKRPSRHTGRLRRCTLTVTVGSFTHADAPGANSARFTGRVNRTPLRVGSYRLQARARNSTGQTSRTIATAFRVIR